MSRTQNIKKNLIFNIIKFATNLLLQFVLRTVLIYYMGAEYLGLNGLFSNIFSFLNLAELGIGSAIVFSMYKPIAENDIEKVKALEHLYKKFYLIISIVVGVVGFAITPALPYLMNGGVSVDINIYILYVMYLVYTLVGYLCAHKRSLLFAYQRNDVENIIRTLCIIGMTIIQIVVLIVFKNYYLYFSISILFTIVECVLIQVSANKLFPEINGKAQPIDKDTKKEITKNVTALSMHKIGGAMVFSTDNILISAFLGVVVLGAYSNYNMITASIVSVFSLINNAIQASAGNLIASTDKEYVYSKYKTINFMFSFLSAFCIICLVSLFQPFIAKWTGGGEYMLEFSTVLMIVLSFYLTRMRTATNLFKDAAGLYWQNKWQPIVESVVNLVTSIVLVKLIGINGIFIGTIISTLVAPFWWEPYVLYKHYFKRSVKEYFGRYLLDFIIMIVCCGITYFVCSFIPDGSWLLLIAKFAVCIVLSLVLLVIAYLPNKEFKELFNMGKNILKNIFHRKKAVAVVQSGEANVDLKMEDKTTDDVDNIIAVTNNDEKIEDSSKE